VRLRTEALIWLAFYSRTPGIRGRQVDGVDSVPGPVYAGDPWAKSSVVGPTRIAVRGREGLDHDAPSAAWPPAVPGGRRP
jgi:hypothetical protein